MKKYRNIIFDLGGVILTIDYQRTIDAFRGLGIPDTVLLYSKASQTSVFDDLEKGNIGEGDFYSKIRAIGNNALSDVQIRDAWNALLIDLPEAHVELLKALKKNHRLFLLSNTNVIHEKAYRKLITEKFGSFIFDDLFEKIYLSHELHMRKPEAAIFEHVLADSRLDLKETCFIDDSPQHIAGAREVGLAAFLLPEQGLAGDVYAIIQ